MECGSIYQSLQMYLVSGPGVGLYMKNERLGQAYMADDDIHVAKSFRILEITTSALNCTQKQARSLCLHLHFHTPALHLSFTVVVLTLFCDLQSLPLSYPFLVWLSPSPGFGSACLAPKYLLSLPAYLYICPSLCLFLSLPFSTLPTSSHTHPVLTWLIP